MKCLDCEGWTLLTHYYDLSPCVAQTALFVAPSLVALSSLHQLYRLQQVDPAFRYSSKWDLFVKQVSILEETQKEPGGVQTSYVAFSASLCTNSNTPYQPSTATTPDSTSNL